MKKYTGKLLFLIVAIFIVVTSLIVSFSENETSCGFFRRKW